MLRSDDWSGIGQLARFGWPRNQIHEDDRTFRLGKREVDH